MPTLKLNLIVPRGGVPKLPKTVVIYMWVNFKHTCQLSGSYPNVVMKTPKFKILFFNLKTKNAIELKTFNKIHVMYTKDV